MYNVAGIRLICPFSLDIDAVTAMLQKQDDVRLITIKDYSQKPKPNGYRSLHLIVEIPVFFSKGKENVRVEIQLRPVAMYFWASLEHSIRNKNDSPAVQRLQEQLKEGADIMARTDVKLSDRRDRSSSTHSCTPPLILEAPP